MLNSPLVPDSKRMAVLQPACWWGLVATAATSQYPSGMQGSACEAQDAAQGHDAELFGFVHGGYTNSFANTAAVAEWKRRC